MITFPIGYHLLQLLAGHIRQGSSAPWPNLSNPPPDGFPIPTQLLGYQGWGMAKLHIPHSPCEPDPTVEMNHFPTKKPYTQCSLPSCNSFSTYTYSTC